MLKQEDAKAKAIAKLTFLEADFLVIMLRNLDLERLIALIGHWTNLFFIKNIY